jgi:hypothetical protein
MSGHTRFAASTAERILTPIPADTHTDVIDTTKGTVHMVLGGGTSVTSNQILYNPPACRVIASLGPVNPATNQRPPVYTQEDAPWSTSATPPTRTASRPSP